MQSQVLIFCVFITVSDPFYTHLVIGFIVYTKY